jgi:hypothetical protein
VILLCPYASKIKDGDEKKIHFNYETGRLHIHIGTLDLSCGRCL